jgi:polyhydroxybutyrate depolymerase
VLAGLLLAGCAGSSGSDDAAPVASPDADEQAADPTTTAAEGGPASSAPVPSAGCGRTEVRSVVLEKTYLDDSERWFLLNTPLEHDGETPIPLVLDVHGLSEGAEVHTKMSDLAAFGDDHGFAVVFPTGRAPRCAGRSGSRPRRTPTSSTRSTCSTSSRPSSASTPPGCTPPACRTAPSSRRCWPARWPTGSPPWHRWRGRSGPTGCEPARPVPVLAFHGTADPILLFNGGVGTRLNEVLAEGPGAEPSDAALPPADLDGPGYPANVAAWAADNGCEDEPADEAETETVTRRTYDCPDGADVEFLILDGGGHSWPGSEFSKAVEAMVGPTDDLDANQEIWDFFQRFALPAG